MDQLLAGPHRPWTESWALLSFWSGGRAGHTSGWPSFLRLVHWVAHVSGCPGSWLLDLVVVLLVCMWCGDWVHSLGSSESSELGVREEGRNHWLGQLWSFSWKWGVSRPSPRELGYRQTVVPAGAFTFLTLATQVWPFRTYSTCEGLDTPVTSKRSCHLVTSLWGSSLGVEATSTRFPSW